MRPQLIDSYKDTQCEINGKWFMAKSFKFFSIRERISHAWLVFTGRATAVYFAEDWIDIKAKPE